MRWQIQRWSCATVMERSWSRITTGRIIRRKRRNWVAAATGVAFNLELAYHNALAGSATPPYSSCAREGELENSDTIAQGSWIWPKKCSFANGPIQGQRYLNDEKWTRT
jgi:hypothetical protein